MKKVYSAKSEAELAVLRSLLDAEGVPHFVHNDAFGSFVVGPRIDNYNAKSIMVADELEDKAREVLLRFEQDTDEELPRTSFRDRLRMVLELVFFSWFVPGRSRRGNRESK